MPPRMTTVLWPGTCCLETGEHLRGGLAVDAEVFAGERPALREGVAEEGDGAAGVVEARKKEPGEGGQEKEEGDEWLGLCGAPVYFALRCCLPSRNVRTRSEGLRYSGGLT